MNYEFPYITNISDVLPAIEGRDEFVVAEKEGYTVINYNVMMADTFPDVLASDDLRANHDHYEVENLHARLRRECRGIIFDTETGEILRRPFHKFFNVNEREETQDHVVDLSRPHAILEKLDGSMIAPFVVIDQMIWGTKMGATDVAKPVEKFVKNNPQYEALANNAILLGLTPIFEWCSRKQRIVLDYKEDTLILTAMRNMKTGEYMDYFYISSFAELAGIPVVRTFEPQTDMKAFVEYVRDLEDLEGFVVRFYDGHMLKLKCHWYLQIHRAKEAILQDRNIVELILDEALDDIKAHLPAEDRFELGRFEHLFNIEVYGQAQLISNMLEHIREENVDRKTFALEIAPAFNQYTRATIFKCWDETDDHKIVEAVKNVIRNNLTKTVKYEAIRDAWFPGVTYND
jgi:T4 RnlA family RNA ligase